MASSPSPANTPLMKTALTAAQGKEILVTLAEVPPHFTGLPHSQAGDEVVCILEGSITFTLDGKPDVTLKAGEPCHISEKQPHFGKTAHESVRFLSIQVKDTGTPGCLA